MDVPIARTHRAPLPPSGCVERLQEEEVFRKWTHGRPEKESKEKGGGAGATGGDWENDTPSWLLTAGQLIVCNRRTLQTLGSHFVYDER